MNTTPIKNFATAARRDLRQHVRDKASALGIGKDGKAAEAHASGDVLIINGIPFPAAIGRQRDALIKRITTEGYEAVVDAMAYTLFNRFCALRFMEVNGYLPQRVFSTAEGDGDTPDVLRHALEVIEEFWPTDNILQKRAREMKVAGDQDNALYSLLLNGQCNALSKSMPFLFQPTGDFSELLMPENLLNTDSFVRQLVTAVPEEDWEEIEIVGWLYQFYIAEKKDEVMGRKKAVPKEDIPAVTQLFTPHWIVRYMVENSLGRLWLLNRPDSKLREHMPYYIEGDKEEEFLKIGSPEEIKVLDPAVGSGHILVYAFDLLHRMYEEDGYLARDIPRLILEHNLHGVEIDERAAALASFALMMKARERDPRYLRRENAAPPQVCCLQEIRWEEGELKGYVDELDLGGLFGQPMLKLLHQFEEAKNFGSLIQPCLDERMIGFARRAIEAKDLGGQLFLRQTHHKVLRVLEQAEILTQRYHVVVANPPYMGAKQMDAPLLSFCENNYPLGFADLFSCFIERAETLTKAGGISGLITMQGWLFQPSFVDLRRRVFAERRMSKCLHLGAAAFDTIGGEVVKTVAFTLNTGVISNTCVFFDLTIPRGESRKEQAFLSSLASDGPPPIQAVLDTRLFLRIPGAPAFYKNSEAMVDVFETSPPLGSLSALKAGLTTGDNVAFQRLWHEVSIDNIFYGCSSLDESGNRPERWYPCSSGGEFRKWYRKSSEIVDWQSNGERIRNFTNEAGKLKSRPQNTQYYFRRGFTWNKLSTSNFAVRLQECGWIYDDTSRCGYPNSERDFDRLFAFLCSSVSPFFLGLLNPSMSFTSGDLGRLPIIDLGDLKYVTEEAVSIARADWDNFETSWDFRDQPLLRPGLKGATLEASWRNWEAQSTAAIRRMQELETENNRLFIEAYGLEDELKPEVPKDQITLGRADRETDVKAFLSYAIGCMMGRYSLDHPGLILANQGETVADYLERIGKSADEITFPPDEDAIVPVLDEAYFDDDCTVRIEEFLKVTFGEATLKENLRFIADALGIKGNETPNDAIRRYLATKFYKDHLNTKNRAYGYKNRPIYWMVTSGKERAFQALIYLHRYTPSTLSRLRTGYLHPLQNKLRARVTDLEGGIETASTNAEKSRLTKQLTKLKKQQAELSTFDEELHHYADMRIELDLDDGVKHNYGLFGNLLAEKKAVTGKK